MPFLVTTYIAFLVITLFANILYWIKIKGKILFLIYELLAGAYIITAIIAYWIPSVKSFCTIGIIPGITAIILFDFYFTVWGKMEDIGIIPDEINEVEMETAKAISVLFMAPAYIIAALLGYEIVIRYIS